MLRSEVCGENILNSYILKKRNLLQHTLIQRVMVCGSFSHYGKKQAFRQFTNGEWLSFDLFLFWYLSTWWWPSSVRASTWRGLHPQMIPHCYARHRHLKQETQSPCSSASLISLPSGIDFWQGCLSVFRRTSNAFLSVVCRAYFSAWCPAWEQQGVIYPHKLLIFNS